MSRRVAPPSAAAACITFGRPMAKLISAPVNSQMVAAGPSPDLVKALNLPSSFAIPWAAPSAAWMSTTAFLRAISASILANPATARPALLARLSASASRRAINRSTRSGRSAGTDTCRLRLRAKAFCRTAAATAARVPSTHTPRPGRRRARSGTIAPSGPATKRISCSGGLCARVSAHWRSGPPSASPWPSASSLPAPIAAAAALRHGHLRLDRHRRGGRLLGELGRFGGRRGGRLLSVHLVEVLLRDPARGDARRHDHVLDVLARELEALEHSLVPDRLGILLPLALRPAGQIVGLGTGEILKRFDVALAEGHEHRRRHTVDLGEIVGDAEFLALGLALGFLPLQVFARAGLDLLGGVLVEALNVRDLAGIDVGHLLHGLKAFGGKQLSNDLVDVEGLHETLRALGELLLPPLRLLLLGQDVDVPAGELRGQPHVLAAAAYGERQLAFGHHHLDAVGILVEHHLGDLGRRQRVDDERGRVRIPLDDVHLLAL